MNISSISGSEILKALSQSEVGLEPNNKDASFFSELKSSIGQTNKLLGDADKANANMVTGKSENLHEAMITMEKAETALKYLIQVRNKAIDAYREVMRMQL